MTIKYNDQTFDVVDNGDGTFTLTAVIASLAGRDLVLAYREVREECQRLASRRVHQRAVLDATIAERDEAVLRRDEIKLLLETAGVADIEEDN